METSLHDAGFQRQFAKQWRLLRIVSLKVLTCKYFLTRGLTDAYYVGLLENLSISVSFEIHSAINWTTL
jgi:uncharacterized membrane protein